MFYIGPTWEGEREYILLLHKLPYELALRSNRCTLLFSSLRAARGDLVPFALLHLLHCLLSKSASVAGAAYTEIRTLAAANSVKLQVLFSQYKKPICQVRCNGNLGRTLTLFDWGTLGI